jgi:hypothetical protein
MSSSLSRPAEASKPKLLDQRAASKKTSPLFEIASLLLCFDHVASFIVNANHSIMSTAEKLTVTYSFEVAPRGIGFRGRRISASPFRQSNLNAM